MMTDGRLNRKKKERKIWKLNKIFLGGLLP
jgi:hypothetical protein